MYITAFDLISNNQNQGSFNSDLKNFYYQSGIDVEEKTLFCVESQVFTGKEFESK